MKFLCLCHYDAAAFAALGPADFKEIGAICAPHDAALKASGHLQFVGSLAMPDQYRTLRADADGVTVADGPYAEAPEPFGAFFLIEAESMDEAEEIARLHPGAHLGAFMRGGIEIRPVDFFEQP
ncbi:MAG TPA: YciI family protein [Allosphingosinicella sp.]|nr:YciI family protein [Allosphingosinicella sp.]